MKTQLIIIFFFLFEIWPSQVAPVNISELQSLRDSADKMSSKDVYRLVLTNSEITKTKSLKLKNKKHEKTILYKLNDHSFYGDYQKFVSNYPPPLAKGDTLSLISKLVMINNDTIELNPLLTDKYKQNYAEQYFTKECEKGNLRIIDNKMNIQLTKIIIKEYRTKNKQSCTSEGKIIFSERNEFLFGYETKISLNRVMD